MSEPDPASDSDPVDLNAAGAHEPAPALSPPLFVVVARSLIAGVVTGILTMTVLLFALWQAEPGVHLPLVLLPGLYGGLACGSLFALAEGARTPYGPCAAFLLAPLVLLASDFGLAFYAVEGSVLEALQWLSPLLVSDLARPRVLIFLLCAAALYVPLYVARRRGVQVGGQAGIMFLSALGCAALALLAPTFWPVFRGSAWALSALTPGEYAAIIFPRCVLFPAALFVGDWVALRLHARLTHAPSPLPSRSTRLQWVLLALVALPSLALSPALQAWLVSKEKGMQPVRPSFESVRILRLAGGEELFERGRYLELEGPNWSWNNLLGVGEARDDMGVPRIVTFGLGPAHDWRSITLIQRGDLVDPVSSFSSDAAYLPWYRAAAEQGHAPAMARVARAHEREGRQEEALAVYWRAAAGGSPAAQWRLGVAYREGSLGLGPDAARARELMRQAAESGAAYYVYRWGRELHGNADRPPSPKVLSLYERAASADSPHAMLELGEVLERAGRTVEATGWYRRAVERTDETPSFSDPGAATWKDVEWRAEAALQRLLEKR